MPPYTEGAYIVEDQPDGSRKIIGYAPNANSNVVAPNARRIAEADAAAAARLEDQEFQRQSNARADATANRQDEEFAYRRERDEAEDARKAATGTGKPMRQGDADKLAEQVDSYSYLKDAIGG